MGYLNQQLEKEAALKLLANMARKIPTGLRAGARGLNAAANKLQPMMRSGISTINTLRKRLPGAVQKFSTNMNAAKQSLGRALYNSRNVAKELPVFKQMASEGWDALKGHASNAYRSLRNGEGLATAGSHLKQGLKSTASHLGEMKEYLNNPWVLPKITGPLKSGMNSMQAAVRNPLHHIRAGFKPGHLRNAAFKTGMPGIAGGVALGGAVLGATALGGRGLIGTPFNKDHNPLPGAVPRFWRG